MVADVRQPGSGHGPPGGGAPGGDPTTGPVVGLLALQGDFANHHEALRAVGLATREVRTAKELHGLGGLVLPGGESTTMLRLLAAEGLEAPLKAWLHQAQRTGIPVLATCAGLILLAEHVHSRSGRPTQRSFGTLPVDVDRNGYGRQVHSGWVPLDWADGALPPGSVPPGGVFIRAPRITAVRTGVEVLAWRSLSDGTRDPVMVRRAQTLGCCFHPELEQGHPVVSMFATMVRQPRRGGRAGAAASPGTGVTDAQSA